MIQISTELTSIKQKNNIHQAFSDNLSLKLLQFLENKMQPHHKYFNIIEIALIIDNYIQYYPNEIIAKVHPQLQLTRLNLTTPANQLKLARHFSQNLEQLSILELANQQKLQLVLQKVKNIFLYYGKATLSYELINEYVYNQQLKTLDHRQKDQDYMQIGEKRVRIDPNLKLCIMPLTADIQICRNTKIKELIFRENQEGSSLQSIFAVTKDYVRCIRLKPELIGIAADFDPTGCHPQHCWYYYQNQYIGPKRTTVNVLFKPQQATALNSKQIKQFRASEATNLEEQYPSHLLNVLKACVGNGVLGMISLDQSLIIEPLSTQGGKNSQGYIGNLMRDVPPEICFKEASKQKYLQILLFQNNNKQWLIVTNKFIYVYRVPLPSQNIVLSQQNNIHRAHNSKPNPLLLLCQRVPQGCLKAVSLQSPFVALMLQRNMVVIIKLIINSQGIFGKDAKDTNISANYYKITNKIYNDIQFKCMTFNSTYNNLFLSDFGSYLMRLSFNCNYGDIEEQGLAYNNGQNKAVNEQIVRNSYAHLKLLKNRSQVEVIVELDDEHLEEDAQQYIEVSYLKSNDIKATNELLSAYQKQSKSPHTIVIKNQTRQVITLMSTNKHFNSLVTYESESIESTTATQFQGQKYREWNNKNKIKVWDIRHMTIYQVIDVSIQVSFLELRSNGMFAVTTDKGYLGFYPFNEDKKIQISKAEQRIIDRQTHEVTEELSHDIILNRGTLYYSCTVSCFSKFSNLKNTRTDIYKLQLQKYPQSQHLQSIPSDVTALTVSDRIYILQNSSEGVQACQLHIYNKMGLKQEMMIFSNRQDVDVATGKIRGDNYNQEYKYMASINHQQFSVVLWNTDSLKLIGGSREDSLTVVFYSPKTKSIIEGVQQIRSIRNIEVTGRLLVVYCQNIVKIKDKAGSVNSKSSKDNKSRPRQTKSMSRVHEHVDYSILVVSCDSDRIVYKLGRISQRVQVLHFHNSLLITRQVDSSNASYDVVRVLDIAEQGELTNKVLFSAKFNRMVTQRLQTRDLSAELHQQNQNCNLLLQQIKQVNIKKTCFLEESRVSISPDNKLIIILVFRVETQYSQVLTNKALQSQVQFMVYARNISDQLLNPDYKISRMPIGKKATKYSYEYQTTTGRTEPVVGHKVLSLEELNRISNYNEVDMEQLCELMGSQSDHKYSGIDITGLITAPNMLRNNREKEVYELLTLRKNQSLFELFNKSPNKLAVINSFNFNLLEFNEDNLTGIVSVSNKLLRTISLHSFGVENKRQNKTEGDQCLLSMNFHQIGLLQVKSQAQMQRAFQLQKAQPGLPRQHLQPIQLVHWNTQYKTQIEQIWDTTFNQIKQLVYQERNKQRKKAPVSSLITPLKIKNQETLRRRLSVLQGQSQAFYRSQQSTPDSMAKMFKKWTIGQAITYEQQQASNIKADQINSIDKYIKKVLQSSEDTITRVTQLISSTSQIKQISKFQPTLKSQVQNQINNIIESAEAAQGSSLKAYVIKKFSSRTNNLPSSTLDSPQISRSQTNTSLMQDIRTSQPPASKLSLASNPHSPKRLGQARTQGRSVDATLQQKLKKKLQQLQDQSTAENRRQYCTPQRGEHLAKTILKTRTEPTPEEAYPSSKSRLMKSATEHSQTTKPIHKSHLGSLMLPAVPHRKSTKTQSSQLSTGFKKKKSSSTKQQGDNGYQISYSLFTLKSAQKLSERLQQTRSPSPSAVRKLQKSERLMREVVLPQMAVNKQKLILKMKQKKSYIKMLQGHLNESSMRTLRKGEQRKQIINKLMNCK